MRLAKEPDEFVKLLQVIYFPLEILGDLYNLRACYVLPISS